MRTIQKTFLAWQNSIVEDISSFQFYTGTELNSARVKQLDIQCWGQRSRRYIILMRRKTLLS